MSIKSSQKSSEISVGKLRGAYKTKDVLNLSVRARGIEYCDGFLSSASNVRSLMLIAVVWINYHLTSVTVNLLQLRGLARPLLTQCPSTPSPLLTAAARQQWRRGAKMINNDWQATGGRVIGHMRNHENCHQQYHENWSAYVAMVGALKQHRQKCMHLAWHFNKSQRDISN